MEAEQFFDECLEPALRWGRLLEASPVTTDLVGITGAIEGAATGLLAVFGFEVPALPGALVEDFAYALVDAAEAVLMGPDGELPEARFLRDLAGAAALLMVGADGVQSIGAKLFDAAAQCLAETTEGQMVAVRVVGGYRVDEVIALCA